MSTNTMNTPGADPTATPSPEVATPTAANVVTTPPATTATTVAATAPAKVQLINTTLLGYFLRRHRILLIILALCSAAFSIMIIAMWPLIVSDSFQEMVEMMAAALPGVDTEMLMMSYGQYLETQWLGIYWLPLAGAVLIVLAAKAIAGNVSDGTMETICAAPLKRSTYVNTVVLVILLISLVLSIATIVPLAALGPVFEAELEAGTIIILLVASWLILFVFGLLVLAASAWTRGVVLPAAFAVAFILVMIVLYLATAVVESLEILNPVNLLHWWGSAGIVDTGSAEVGLWIWLAVVGVVSLAAIYTGFLRRDLT